LQEVPPLCSGVSNRALVSKEEEVKHPPLVLLYNALRRDTASSSYSGRSI
jgi:hypothetical protein